MNLRSQIWGLLTVHLIGKINMLKIMYLPKCYTVYAKIIPNFSTKKDRFDRFF